MHIFKRLSFSAAFITHGIRLLEAGSLTEHCHTTCNTSQVQVDITCKYHVLLLVALLSCVDARYMLVMNCS